MLLTGLFSLFMGSLVAQEILINYDETKIPAYELPDPLIFNNGKKVANADEWTEKRRAEILEIFAQEMYGHVPARPDGQHFKVLREETVYEGEDASTGHGGADRKMLADFISCVAEGTGKSLDSVASMTDGTVNLSRRKQMN